VKGIQVLADAAGSSVGRHLPLHEYRDVVIGCMGTGSDDGVNVQGLRFLVELWSRDPQSRIPVGPHVALLHKMLIGTVAQCQALALAALAYLAEDSSAVTPLVHMLPAIRGAAAVNDCRGPALQVLGQMLAHLQGGSTESLSVLGVMEAVADPPLAPATAATLGDADPTVQQNVAVQQDVQQDVQATAV